jgi:hypothetical protein
MPNGAGDYPNFRSVQDLLAQFYGGVYVTQPEETDYTVGTTAVPVGGKLNGMRIGFVLSNTGATNFAVSFKAGVTITTGIFISPGRFWRSDWYYDGDLVSLQVYAISSAGGGTLHMLERFLTGA